jgi:hypothetical protein
VVVVVPPPGFLLSQEGGVRATQCFFIAPVLRGGTSLRRSGSRIECGMTRRVCAMTGRVCGMTGVCVFPGLTRDPVMATYCHDVAPRPGRGCGRAASRIPAFAGRRGKGYAVLLHCPGAERWHESAAFWIPHRVRDDRGACGMTGGGCGMTEGRAG